MTGQELVTLQGWGHRPSGANQIAVQTCPLCQATWKFFMNEESGLWDCKSCSTSGNLYQLRERLGIITDSIVVSVKDAASKSSPLQPLPDLKGMHKRLLEDPAYGDVLDYLIAERQFSMAVIEKMMLGADAWQDKRWYMIPYINASGTITYFKGRSLPVPGEKKAFRSPAGREAGLYNDSCIHTGMDELVIVEGEADCLSLLSQGYETVVAVPGASVKKTTWIDKIDQACPKTVYLCYDTDKPGQENALAMAKKVGLNRVRNIVLPAFSRADGSPGKDLNEWFCAGNTVSDFSALQATAKAFDVDGVQNVARVLEELREDIEGRGTTAKYSTPWPSLNERAGGFEDGDLIGWMAQAKVGKSTAALNLLHYYAQVEGYCSFMYCQEMPPKRLVRKWVSHVTQTDDSPGNSKITVESVATALEIARGMKSDILFGFTPSRKMEDVFDTIRQTVRRYGVQVVCFDNLQMMVGSLEHSAQETSKITKGFKSLAMELGILIHLIIQPNRVAEGQIVAARNAMGSSAIEKDVDMMICLHRNRVGKITEKDFTGFMETNDNFEPYLLARVDLARYAPGGVCTLFMDGSTSTIREFSDTDLVPSAAVNKGAGLVIDHSQVEAI